MSQYQGEAIFIIYDENMLFSFTKMDRVSFAIRAPPVFTPSHMGILAHEHSIIYDENMWCSFTKMDIVSFAIRVAPVFTPSHMGILAQENAIIYDENM